MKKKSLIFLPALFLLISFGAYNVRTGTLTYKLKQITAGKEFRAGIAVIENKKSWTAGNEKYPLMSVFKLFIAAAVLNKLENEGTDLNTTIQITRDMVDKNMYSPMYETYQNYPYKMTVGELLERMVSESDNNACDILLAYIGGTDRLKTYLDDLGFTQINIAATEQEMNADIKKQYLNSAAPLDVIRFIKLAREGKILSPAHQAFFDKIMIQTKTGPDKLKSGVPGQIVTGHKTGSSSRTEKGVKIADNDAGFVTLPDGRTYYIAVMIADSKMSDKDNAAVISKISETVYEHFR